MWRLKRNGSVSTCAEIEIRGKMHVVKVGRYLRPLANPVGGKNVCVKQLVRTKGVFHGNLFFSCLALAWLFASCWLTAQTKDPSWLLGFTSYLLGFFGAIAVTYGMEQDRIKKEEED